MRVKTHVAVFTRGGFFFSSNPSKRKSIYFRFVLLPVQSPPIPDEPEAATQGNRLLLCYKEPRARRFFSYMLAIIAYGKYPYNKGRGPFTSKRSAAHGRKLSWCRRFVFPAISELQEGYHVVFVPGCAARGLKPELGRVGLVGRGCFCSLPLVCYIHVRSHAGRRKPGTVLYCS